MADPIDVRIIGGQGELKVDAHVTAIDRETFKVRVIEQKWKYKVAAIASDEPRKLQEQLDSIGREQFELVCVIGRNLVFKKTTQD